MAGWSPGGVLTWVMSLAILVMLIVFVVQFA
jgi:hypothetical protein